MIRKFVSATVSPVGEREVRIIASTGDVDRAGEIIEPLGIHFAASVPLLWQHQPDVPVGRASELTVAAGKLRALATFAPAGLSSKVDEICALTKVCVIAACSVGFDPLRSEPMGAGYPVGARRDTEIELLEISLVSVAANAEATVEKG